MLENLRPGHPRLMALDEDIERVRSWIATEPQARAIYDHLNRKAAEIMQAPPVEYRIVGPRLLAQSRRCLDRVATLGLLYRLEGNPRILARATAELEAAAEFPDWNPAHFLDTAEMAHAFALGYDWFYDALSEEVLASLRTALVEKGLKPSLEFYQAGKWWVRAAHNWNQVCNGGIAIGALAVADEEPELAEYILSQAVESIRRPMERYAPDGGWEEGPSYWHYATRYSVYFLAALESALGTDFGLAEMPGFRETGMFRIHFVGPLGRTFNYADAPDPAGGAEEMFWLARKFGRPLYAWHQRQYAAPNAWDLLWFDPHGAGPLAESTPRDAFFRGVDVAFFRSAWEDPQALFVGFKGGHNGANHSHLDLGTFVLDAQGHRWSLDLGPDDYNLRGYFGPQRWTYFRLRTEGHSTLLINGENQNPSASAPLIAFSSTEERAFAVADLTAAYTPHTRWVQRGVALLGRRQVLIQDEIEAEDPVEVLWEMVTPATIALEGATATLKQGEARLIARLLTPEDAHFEVLFGHPPPPQAQQPQVRKLMVFLAGKVSNLRIAVLLTPVTEETGPASTPEVVPLREWGEGVQPGP